MGSASYPIITLLTLDIICAMSTFSTAINSMRTKVMTLFVQFSIQIIDTKHTFVEKKKRTMKAKYNRSLPILLFPNSFENQTQMYNSLLDISIQGLTWS